jgi:hypothetical protein
VYPHGACPIAARIAEVSGYDFLVQINEFRLKLLADLNNAFDDASSFPRVESIANPWFGSDVLARTIAFKFLPQLTDEHAQIFGLLNAFWSPYRRQKHSVR